MKFKYGVSPGYASNWMRALAVPEFVMRIVLCGRYIPPRIKIVWPGCTTAMALFNVANGAASVPGLASLPVGAMNQSPFVFGTLTVSVATALVTLP